MPDSFKFNHLPLEVHFALSQYLSVKDLVSIERTSQKLREMYQPLTWSKVYICDEYYNLSDVKNSVYINDPSYRVVPASVFKRLLKYKTTCLTTYVKQIYSNYDNIANMSPELDYNQTEIQIQEFINQSFPNLAEIIITESAKDIKKRHQSIDKTDCFTSLINLPSLKDISFFKCGNGIEQLYPNITTKIKRIEFTFRDFDNHYEIPLLPNLESLLLTSKYNHEYTNYKATIKSLNTQTPRLKHLELDFCSYNKYDNFSLNALTHIPHGLETCKVRFNFDVIELLDQSQQTFDLQHLTLPQVTHVSISEPQMSNNYSFPNYLLYLHFPNVIELHLNYILFPYKVTPIINFANLTKLRLQFFNKNSITDFVSKHSQNSTPALKHIWIQLNLFNNPLKWDEYAIELTTDAQVEMVQCLAAAANNWQLIAKAKDNMFEGNNMKEALKALEPSFPDAHKKSDGASSPYYMSYKHIMDIVIYPMVALSNVRKVGNSYLMKDPLDRNVFMLTFFYACMEVIYDRLFNMKSLETAVVDSAFSIDHSPAFQRLVHSHQTLKTLFVSEYQEKALPVVPNAMEYINKDRKCPQIINKDYMEHTTEVLVADDNIYTENVYSDSGNFYCRSQGRYDYEQCSQYLPVLTPLDFSRLEDWKYRYDLRDTAMLNDCVTSCIKKKSALVATAPRIMSRVDVAGIRNNYSTALNSGLDYYYDKSQTSLGNNTGLPTDETQELDPRCINEYKSVDQERIQRHLNLATAYKQQYLGKLEFDKMKRRYHRDELRDTIIPSLHEKKMKHCEMLPFINYNTIDIYGV